MAHDDDRTSVVHILPVLDARNSYGGPATVCLDIAVAQARRDGPGRVVVVSGYRPRNGAPDVKGLAATGVRAVVDAALPMGRFGPGWVISVPATVQVWRQVRRARVVHLHGIREPLVLAGALMSWVLRVPYIVQCHGMVQVSRPMPVLDAVVTFALRRARSVLALTAVEREILTRRGVRRVRLFVNPVRTEAGEAPSAAAGGYVLFCGRLHPRKRVGLFLASLDELCGDDIPPVRIVGHDEGDGAIVSRWLAGRPDASWTPGVGIDEARRIIAGAAVLVVTARDEPFGLTMVEAVAAGTLLVVTRDVQLAASLEAGGAAVICEATPSSVADGIRSVLRASDAEARRARARQWLGRLPTTEEAIDELDACYARPGDLRPSRWRAATSEQALSDYSHRFGERDGTVSGFLLRHPAQTFLALCALLRLPLLTAEVTDDDDGALIGQSLGRPFARLVPVGLAGVAVLDVPDDPVVYGQGSSKQTLRRKTRSAQRMGVTVRPVADPDERHRLLALAREAELNHPDERYRRTRPDLEPLLDHDLWLAAFSASGEPLVLSVTPVSGRWAVLHYFRILGQGKEYSDARYLTTWALVEHLVKQGVRHLADGRHPLGLPNGLRHFQRMVGFRTARVKVTSAPRTRGS